MAMDFMFILSENPFAMQKRNTKFQMEDITTMNRPLLVSLMARGDRL